MQNAYTTLLESQRQFFATGTTLSIDFRIKQLVKLKNMLKTHSDEISAALYKDLHKNFMEAAVTEISLVSNEVNYIIKNLNKWAKPTKVPSPFPMNFPGRSSIHYQPYGSVLIISPWNFPYLLTMSPLAGAISAGNCVIVKPSELAPHTEELIIKLINENFPANYIATFKAGPEEMPQILNEKYDYIFYTGGTHIGKIIMQAAAQHLTPVTLELGGKSPCIIDESANIDFAARRIIWSKFMNAGQVCIAPDYLFVHQSHKQILIPKLIATIEKFYGTNPEKSSSYGRIINKKHFDRILQLMQNSKIIYGGKTIESELYIAPTLIGEPDWDQPVMQEEIFGPLLPILFYTNIDDVIKQINSQSKPLGLYVFTKNSEHENKIISNTYYGGGCINDCILQIANYHLPFGGAGASGMGSYHGKYSFETFSHKKSIFKKTFPLDLGLEYPPFTSKKFAWLKRLT